MEGDQGGREDSWIDVQSLIVPDAHTLNALQLHDGAANGGSRSVQQLADGRRGLEQVDPLSEHLLTAAVRGGKRLAMMAQETTLL